MPYCPRCGTALSSHEVSQGYKEVKERSAVVRFKVVGQDTTYIYAWTTTPWTLPSNVALCVNPHETYARFDCEGRTIIMGDALIEKVQSLQTTLDFTETDEYVIRTARNELGMIMPGEVRYVSGN